MSKRLLIIDKKSYNIERDLLAINKDEYNGYSKTKFYYIYFDFDLDSKYIIITKIINEDENLIEYYYYDDKYKNDQLNLFNEKNKFIKCDLNFLFSSDIINNLTISELDKLIRYRKKIKKLNIENIDELKWINNINIENQDFCYFYNNNIYISNNNNKYILELPLKNGKLAIYENNYRKIEVEKNFNSDGEIIIERIFFDDIGFDFDKIKITLVGAGGGGSGCKKNQKLGFGGASGQVLFLTLTKKEFYDYNSIYVKLGQGGYGGKNYDKDIEDENFDGGDGGESTVTLYNNQRDIHKMILKAEGGEGGKFFRGGISTTTYIEFNKNIIIYYGNNGNNNGGDNMIGKGGNCFYGIQNSSEKGIIGGGGGGGGYDKNIISFGGSGGDGYCIIEFFN